MLVCHRITDKLTFFRPERSSKKLASQNLELTTCHRLLNLKDLGSLIDQEKDATTKHS